MADPLSIAAGVTGVASVAISTCKLIFRVAENVIEARRKILDLARSLNQFSSSLKHLASVTKSASRIIRGRGLRDIDNLREYCYEIVLEIKRVFKKVDTVSPSTFDRVKWLFMQSDLRYLKKLLSEAKTDLHLRIDILNLSLNLRHAANLPYLNCTC